jgi:hypothetical protein
MNHLQEEKSQIDQALQQVNNALAQMGASVFLITQSGKIVLVSESLRAQPRSWLGGQAIEVMISSPNADPYFIYYENEGYYFKMAGSQQSISQQSISNIQEYEAYRSNVSQALCMHLVLHLMKTQGRDIRHPQMSFSHNRIHTNVVAYVEKLSNWYPIQHSSAESDSATERKVAQVNSGAIDITEVIAVHEPSPA